MSRFSDALDHIQATIDARRDGDAGSSWTAKLLADPKLAAKKLGEEAIEAVMAAVLNDRKNLTDEAADLLYHLMVVLKIADIPLKDVLGELERRTVQSGLKEKASRQSQ